MTLVSIVIVSLNGSAVLPACLRAIQKLDWPREQLETIIVNNGSTDGTRELLAQFATDRVRAINLPQNFGFAGGNNRGIAEASGDWVILLNDDTEVEPDWLRVLMESAAENPHAGILGSLLLYPDRRTIQHAGGNIDAGGLSSHIGWGDEDIARYNVVRQCDYVTGAAFAIRRDVLNRIGLLDAGFWPIYFEEVDYCYRARRAGYQVLQTPAVTIHHESRTTVVNSPGFLRKYHRNRMRFVVLNLPLRGWLLAELRLWRREWRKQPKAILLNAYLRAVVRLPYWLVLRNRRINARQG